jgi:DNA recombination protein RmuC
MNEYSILYTVVGFVSGAVIAWLIARSRASQALAEAAATTLEASSLLQIELSSFKERASRVPDLEGKLEECVQHLNAANERKATLESEVLRAPEIDAARVRALEQLDAASRLTATLREHVSKLSAELSADRDTLGALREELIDTKSHLAAKVDEAASQAVSLGELRNTLQGERGNSEEKLNLLLEAKEVLANQFKSLANDILEEKSKRFTEQNQTNLGALLDPLKTKITEFQTKIEDTYVREGQERSALGVELKHLKELNQQLSEDAKNLTRALKGSAKAQGTWGEWILEKVLEGSGLRRDHEYVVQSSHTREDGTRALPDVIIHLPEGRSLVIDSKVSLVAYEEFAVTENEAERAAAGKRFRRSRSGSAY